MFLSQHAVLWRVILLPCRHSLLHLTRSAPSTKAQHTQVYRQLPCGAGWTVEQQCSNTQPSNKPFCQALATWSKPVVWGFSGGNCFLLQQEKKQKGKNPASTSAKIREGLSSLLLYATCPSNGNLRVGSVSVNSPLCYPSYKLSGDCILRNMPISSSKLIKTTAGTNVASWFHSPVTKIDVFLFLVLF